MAGSYGALGYVTKKSSAAEIVLAVRAVLAGKTAFETCRAPRAPEELEAFNQVSRVIGSLTPQQTTVLRLLGERSEEHTSELQSLMRISYAVFCLKKKKHRRQYVLNNTLQHIRDGLKGN